ncbi:PilZ domain-containing protein [Sphingomonas sp. MMS12-HWE2-04]|uniref:PilZ domain-containing protein n=1 Tax=Sphingomonas sp. MMS12-HWE2-04 TaxID=3234199 RepID=UPI00384BDEB5
MSYHDPQSVFRPLHQEGRKQSRVALSMDITLGSSSVGRRKVDLLDLSASGCRVECHFDVEPGRHLVLTIPGLAPIGCEVRWRRNGMLGLHFASALHPSVLDRVVAQACNRR